MKALQILQRILFDPVIFQNWNLKHIPCGFMGRKVERGCCWEKQVEVERGLSPCHPFGCSREKGTFLIWSHLGVIATGPPGRSLPSNDDDDDFNFHGDLVDLQCCVSFGYTAK